MDRITNGLLQFGYSDCFFKDGFWWGFLDGDVLPTQIPSEIIRSVGLASPRQRLVSRMQFWCDEHGIKI